MSLIPVACAKFVGDRSSVEEGLSSSLATNELDNRPLRPIEHVFGVEGPIGVENSEITDHSILRDLNLVDRSGNLTPEGLRVQDEVAGQWETEGRREPLESVKEFIAGVHDRQIFGVQGRDSIVLVRPGSASSVDGPRNHGSSDAGRFVVSNVGASNQGCGASGIRCSNGRVCCGRV